MHLSCVRGLAIPKAKCQFSYGVDTTLMKTPFGHLRVLIISAIGLLNIFRGVPILETITLAPALAERCFQLTLKRGCDSTRLLWCDVD